MYEKYVDRYRSNSYNISSVDYFYPQTYPTQISC